jgi:hypothetical protein
MFWKVRIENSMHYKTEHQMRSYMRPAWRGKGHIIRQMWKSTQMGSCLKFIYEYYSIHQINVTNGDCLQFLAQVPVFCLNVDVPMRKTAASSSRAIYGVRIHSFTILCRFKNCNILLVNCPKLYLDRNGVQKISISHRTELLPYCYITPQYRISVVWGSSSKGGGWVNSWTWFILSWYLKLNFI